MKSSPEIYSGFIDILFAIVIAQSFVLLEDKDWYRPYFEYPVINAFNITLILLVYTLIITSWIGYHESIIHHKETVYRFIIDILLLFLYYLAFVSIKDFNFILTIFNIIFFIYLIWDFFRIFENYKSKEKWKLVKRTGVTALFFTIYFFVHEIYNTIIIGVEGIEWAILIVMFVLLIMYRVSKLKFAFSVLEKI